MIHGTSNTFYDNSTLPYDNSTLPYDNSNLPHFSYLHIWYNKYNNGWFFICKKCGLIVKTKEINNNCTEVWGDDINEPK